MLSGAIRVRAYELEGPQEVVRPIHPNTVKHIMERACLRKKNLSEEQANQIVDRNMKQGKLIYFYKCQYCNSHHMTKSAPSRKIEKQHQKFGVI